jgi:hypothetical protein
VATNKQATLEVLVSYNDGNGVFCGSVSRLYNEDPRPTEIIIKALDTVVEVD